MGAGGKSRARELKLLHGGSDLLNVGAPGRFDPTTPWFAGGFRSVTY